MKNKNFRVVPAGKRNGKTQLIRRLKNFQQISPCIYVGEILCSECAKNNHDDCDMMAGRELHQKYFELGVKYGLSLPRPDGESGDV